MTKKEIKIVERVIDNEGFDYAFNDYTDFKEIKDEEFHKLRLLYIEATQKLIEYLKEQGLDPDLT